MHRDGEHGLLGILKETVLFDVNIFMLNFNNIYI